eukprot:TRINITY_DN10505_c0_g1_i1.p1 TRINITY_DN10505_c0_g1~~TRINITY_DN10505_c0_g1_i1.p1  ORF type:complete len:1189 (+),score=251.06 TRINITY_DN10505_c0_g1_i1:246-3569(+)
MAAATHLAAANVPVNPTMPNVREPRLRMNVPPPVGMVPVGGIIQMVPPAIENAHFEVPEDHAFSQVVHALKYAFIGNQWLVTPDGRNLCKGQATIKDGKLSVVIPADSDIFAKGPERSEVPCYVQAAPEKDQLHQPLPGNIRYVKLVMVPNFYLETMKVDVEHASDLNTPMTAIEPCEDEHSSANPNQRYYKIVAKPGSTQLMRASCCFDKQHCYTSHALRWDCPTMVPERPSIPTVTGRQPTTLTLKVKGALGPDQTGGLPLHFYELQRVRLHAMAKSDDALIDKADTEAIRIHLRQDADSNAKGKSKNKSHAAKVENLKPNTLYKFRLRARNDRGFSAWSEWLHAATPDQKPKKPYPPTLAMATAASLTLNWDSCGVDNARYTVQGEGEYGWMPWFNEIDRYQCTKTDLQRSTTYKVRMQVDYGTQGPSDFSDVVEFTTSAAAPAAPAAPKCAKAPTKTELVLCWKPTDDGGADIVEYMLERDQGQPAAVDQDATSNDYKPRGKAMVVHKGPEQEAAVCDLKPGHIYHFRVSCSNAGGLGSPSQWSRLSTAPDIPLPPSKLAVNHITANVARVDWGKSASHGGAKVGKYRLELQRPGDDAFVEVYNDDERKHRLEGLEPGSEYAVRVACHSRVGWSEWTDAVTFKTLASAPAKITDLSVSSNKPNELSLSWTKPEDHGEPVLEYAVHAVGVQPAVEETVVTTKTESVTLKSLKAATDFAVFVVAKNKAGASVPSTTLQVTTASTSPSCMIAPAVVDVKHDHVVVQLTPPDANGAEITHYRVSVNGSAETIDVQPDSIAHAVVPNLRPDKAYKIRAQAINAVGPSPLSPPTTCSTTTVPPEPPLLEVTAVTHAVAKLKWTSDKSILDTELEYASEGGSYQRFYSGRGKAAKLPKLNPKTTYTVRGRHLNEAGWGEFSPPVTITTTEAMRAAPTTLLCAPTFERLVFTLSEEDVTEVQIRSVGPTLGLRLQVNDADPRSFCVTSQYVTVCKQHVSQLVVLDMRPGQTVEVRARFPDGIFCLPKTRSLLQPHADSIPRQRLARRPDSSDVSENSEAASDTQQIDVASKLAAIRRARKQTNGIELDKTSIVFGLLVLVLVIPALLFVYA